MKNVIFLMFMGLVASASLRAQQPAAPYVREITPEEQAKMATNRMSKGLSLSQQQYDAVYAANLERIRSSEAARAQLKAAKEAMQKQRMQSQATFDAKIMPVLDANQQAAYRQWQLEREARHAEHRAHKKGGHPGAHGDNPGHE